MKIAYFGQPSLLLETVKKFFTLNNYEFQLMTSPVSVFDIAGMMLQENSADVVMVDLGVVHPERPLEDTFAYQLGRDLGDVAPVVVIASNADHRNQIEMTGAFFSTYLLDEMLPAVKAAAQKFAT